MSFASIESGPKAGAWVPLRPDNVHARRISCHKYALEILERGVYLDKNSAAFLKKRSGAGRC